MTDAGLIASTQEERAETFRQLLIDTVAISTIKGDVKANIVELATQRFINTFRDTMEPMIKECFEQLRKDPASVDKAILRCAELCHIDISKIRMDSEALRKGNPWVTAMVEHLLYPEKHTAKAAQPDLPHIND